MAASTGAYTFGQLEALWVANGGPPAWAPTMAGIALAESGGNPSATNPSGATGLFQIEMPLHDDLVPGATTQASMLDPNTNVQAAIKLLGSGSGISAWVGDPVGNFAQNGQPLSLPAAESLVKQLGFSTTDATDPGTLSSSTATATLDSAFPGGSWDPLNDIPGVSSIPAAASDLSAVNTLFGDITSTAFWMRVGMGVGGLALFIVGLSVFFESTDTGKKITSDGIKAGEMAAMA